MIVACNPYIIEGQLYTESSAVSTYALDSATGVAVPMLYELLVAEPGYCSTEGCMDPGFLEFDPFAVADNGACQTPRVLGCTYSQSSNFDPAANVDDGSCVAETDDNCPEDVNGDGIIGVSDVLILLSQFGQSCS